MDFEYCYESDDADYEMSPLSDSWVGVDGKPICPPHITSHHIWDAQLFFEVQEKSLLNVHKGAFTLFTIYSYVDDSDDTNDKGDSQILLYEFGPQVTPPDPRTIWHCGQFDT